MDKYALICAAGYLGVKLLVRWVWYRNEHRRPGFLRNNFVVRALDFSAVLFLVAMMFFLINRGRIRVALVAPLLLLAYDALLRILFLHIEARYLCAKSPRLDLKSAKRQLRRRVKRESPF